MAQHPDHQAANQTEPNPPQNEGRQSATTEEHRAQAPASVRCFVLTVSDTRSEADDSGGALIRELLEAAGHQLVGSRIVRDDKIAIGEALSQAMDGLGDPDVIIATGGSGIGPRDVTPESVCPRVVKEMPGFGEEFRRLSWAEIGAAAMLSRAFAGVIGRTLVFVLPGSVNAVRLAMEKIIVPELGHLVREVRPERREA